MSEWDEKAQLNKPTNFADNLVSVITGTIHYKNVYQVWLCPLSELSILTSFFFKNRLFRIYDTIFTAPGYFSEGKYDISNYCSIFFYTIKRQNIVLLKPYILQKTFQVLMLKWVHLLWRTCFVKDKINLDIILSE